MRTKGTVKGLTTAATLWLIACVGLAVGMGYYLISIMTIALTMTVLIFLHLVQNILLKGRGLKHIEVTMCDKREAMNYINDYCVSHHVLINNIELHDMNAHLEEGTLRDDFLTYSYTVLIPRTVTVESMLLDFQMNENILAASIINDAYPE